MIREKFEKIIFNTAFASSIQSETEIKAMDELKIFFGQDLTKMINYDQMAPHHDRDLWKHTAVFMAAIPILGRSYNISKDELEFLTVMGFFHDFGKPNTMTETKFDKVPLLPDKHPSRRFQTPTDDGLSIVTLHSFKGHAEESRKLAAYYLDLMRYNFHDANRIKFYIAHHDDYMRIRKVDEESILKMADITCGIIQNAQKTDFPINARTFQLLMLIGKCDAAAQAAYVYEFDAKKNEFPPMEQPSDTLRRKVETYDEIEANFPKIFEASIKLITQKRDNALTIGDSTEASVYEDQIKIMQKIQGEFKPKNNQSLDTVDEGPSFE